MIITVDCGTTNMRSRLYKGEALVDEVRRKAGVRNTAFSGSTEFLVTSLKESIAELLERNRLNESDIEVVISSGTLSSDVGIHTIPHVLAPVGLKETAAHAEMVTMPEITNIPILFLPGVKTLPAPGTPDGDGYIEILDSMSGEECETYGISKLLGINGDFVITLPGSYTKTLEVDRDGKITSMRTGMCGEFIAAIAEHTLLRHSLPDPPIRVIIPDKLCRGYDYCCRHGASPSLIKARMVRVHGGWSEDEAGNFYVGTALADDIKLTLEVYKKGKPVILGGTFPLRNVFEILLRHAGIDESDLIVTDDLTSKIASNIGAMEVYHEYMKNRAGDLK